VTPAPVSTATTLGGGPAAVGPSESPAPTSPAETDEYVDDPAVSPFERILSRGHGAPLPGRTARPADDHTGPAAPSGNGPVPGLPAPPSEVSPNAGSGGGTSLDVDTLVSLDLGVTASTDSAGGADATRKPEGARVPGATHEADGPAGEAGAPVDAGSPDVGSAPLVAATASVDASSHDAAMAPTTVVGPGRTSPVSITSVATSLDNGKPLSLPPPAPGFGIASGPSGSRGAVPAAENPPGAAAPRATGPGTTASAATGGIAPTAVAVVVESELGGDATDATGATGAADVSLDTAGLATSISGALSRGSGSYNVVLNLHPPELGQVQATLSLRGDQLQVDLSPEHAAARDALENALPALREHLAQGGVEVDVTLGDPGTAHQGAPAGGSTGQSSQRGEADTDESDGSIAAASASASAGPSPAPADRLHLVL
jgi:Flagellar hook-length control protein FliK